MSKEPDIAVRPKWGAKGKMRSFDYPPYFDNLVQFYADPEDKRTILQFAEENNINPATVHQFKRNHGKALNDAVELIRPQYKVKIKNQAYKALFNRINKSDLALKLAFQLSGELVERSEVVTSYMTPEQKREKASELLAKLSAKLTAAQAPIAPPASLLSETKGIGDSVAKEENKV